MIRFAPLNKQDSNSSVSTPVGKHGKPTKEAQVSSIILDVSLSPPPFTIINSPDTQFLWLMWGRVMLVWCSQPLPV